MVCAPLAVSLLLDHLARPRSSLASPSKLLLNSQVWELHFLKWQQLINFSVVLEDAAAIFKRLPWTTSLGWLIKPVRLWDSLLCGDLLLSNTFYTNGRLRVSAARLIQLPHLEHLIMKVVSPSMSPIILLGRIIWLTQAGDIPCLILTKSTLNMDLELVHMLRKTCLHSKDSITNIILLPRSLRMVSTGLALQMPSTNLHVMAGQLWQSDHNQNMLSFLLWYATFYWSHYFLSL